MRNLEVRRASDCDFAAICQLHRSNLRSTLGEDELKNGFLTVNISPQDLQRANEVGAVYIATIGTDLIGYVIGTPLEYNLRFPLNSHAIELLKRLEQGVADGLGTSTYFYGPICVHSEHRGKGVLDILHGALQRHMSLSYSWGVTFVSMDNPRSLWAHTKKLGWVDISHFEFAEKGYALLTILVEPSEPEHRRLVDAENRQQICL